MHNQDFFLKKKKKKKSFPCLLSFDSLWAEGFTEEASSNHLEENKGQGLEEEEALCPVLTRLQQQRKDFSRWWVSRQLGQSRPLPSQQLNSPQIRWRELGGQDWASLLYLGWDFGKTLLKWKIFFSPPPCFCWEREMF
ncbi:hypothetical protein L345_03750, partial [Ophiophagus hannah]